MICGLGFLLFFKRNNKVLPICHNEKMYYDLLQAVNKGNPLSQEELKFLYSLPRENLLVIIKLYNINSYNRVILLQI